MASELLTKQNCIHNAWAALAIYKHHTAQICLYICVLSHYNDISFSKAPIYQIKYGRFI